MSASPAPTVVVVHAHPDDEAIFTGATIHGLTRAGVRVVLVTATDGAAGVPRRRLPSGRSLAAVRQAELERACSVLGVARLVLLGYRDSGAHAGPYARGSLGAEPAGRVARRVARIVEEEGASTVIHYDAGGIYGHVDHVQVHRTGALAARRLGISEYQATVDGDALRRGPRHVLHAAAGDTAQVGVPAASITLSLQSDDAGLRAKRAAMASHSSQIGAEFLDPEGFEATYGHEWFVRRGPVGVLETHLAHGRTGSRSGPGVLVGGQ